MFGSYLHRVQKGTKTNSTFVVQICGSKKALPINLYIFFTLSFNDYDWILHVLYAALSSFCFSIIVMNLYIEKNLIIC